MDLETDRRMKPGGLAEVFLMAYPTVVTMFSHALMSFADTVMVGTLGYSEIGAVGLANVLFFTTLSVFMGSVEITNTFASQSFGSGDEMGASRFGWQGMYMGLLGWPVIILVSLGFPALFEVLGPSEKVQALGSSYGMVRLWGSGPFLAYVALTFFFRGVGMVKVPMIGAVIMNLVNFNLDCLLIPRMGVEGAAWASNIGIVAATVFIIAAFLRSSMHERFGTRSSWRPSARLMIRMAKVGLPAGVHFFIDVAAFTIFVSFIGRMGDVALAASQIALQIEQLSFNICWGFTVATTTLVGQYIGAKRPDLAIASVKSAARLFVSYLLVFLVVISISPGWLLGLFTEEERVIDVGAQVLYLAMTFMIFDGIGMIAVGALRGAGDTRFPMFVSLIAAWAFFLPLAYLFGQVFGGGVLGAWLACSVYIIGVSMVYVARFAGGKWKKMEI